MDKISTNFNKKKITYTKLNNDLEFLNNLELLEKKIRNNTQLFLLNYSKTLFFVPNQTEHDLINLN